VEVHGKQTDAPESEYVPVLQAVHDEAPEPEYCCSKHLPVTVFNPFDAQ
jgi:hypothetical protein